MCLNHDIWILKPIFRLWIQRNFYPNPDGANIIYPKCISNSFYSRRFQILLPCDSSPPFILPFAKIPGTDLSLPSLKSALTDTFVLMEPESGGSSIISTIVPLVSPSTTSLRRRRCGSNVCLVI